MGATGEPTLEEIQRAKYILTLSEKEKKELNMLEPIYKTAVSALEKQIPQKPITYKGTNCADCPICGARVRGIDKPFGNWCSKCGQALDWRKE